MSTDTHAHIWRSAPAYHDLQATIMSPLADIPAELLEQYMGEDEVGRAVLVQPMYWGQDNSLVCAYARAAPERFAAVAVVDPRASDGMKRVSAWAAQGCRGIRLRPRIEAGILDGITSTGAWAEIETSGLVVSVLGGVEDLPDIYDTARRAPNVAMVLDHMGYPDVSGGVRVAGFKSLLRLSELPNVVVKLSGYYYFSREGYPYRDCWPLVKAVYEAFGPQRLIWGSDFPHCLLRSGYTRQVRLPERFFDFLSPADLAAIMSANAERLYWGTTGQVTSSGDAGPA